MPKTEVRKRGRNLALALKVRRSKRRFYRPMRIAYIAPYQGESLLKQRPLVLNRSLSGTVKMGLIARLLRECGHEVEIISQGEVVENTWQYYAGYSDAREDELAIPVHYASAFPVPRLNGTWSSARTLRLLKTRHAESPFDLVLVWNLKGPQLSCATYALRKLSLPVILEYEDDKFVDRSGQPVRGLLARRTFPACRRLLRSISGGLAVSPHLLSQFPEHVPTLLLRGVVGPDVVAASQRPASCKRPIILFSGTHVLSNGVAELIKGWQTHQVPGWELHITGQGELTGQLQREAHGVPNLWFHGMIDRGELLALMSSARICINPHAVSNAPGSLFAFKIIEYLAAGAHVVTTPMGRLEPSLEVGITYMPDNLPETIVETLDRVVQAQRYELTAAEAAHGTYGHQAVASALGKLIDDVAVRHRAAHRESPAVTFPAANRN